MNSEEESKSWPFALMELRKQHHVILEAFDRYLRVPHRLNRSELLMELCRQIRLHVTVEAGVFYPALADQLSSLAILAEAGVEFAYVTQLINEISDENTNAELLLRLTNRLRCHFLAHVEAAEKAGGLFERAATLDLSWETLRHRLWERRQALQN